MTLNVRGLADRIKRKKLFQYLYDKHVDIALLQETHSSKKMHKRWQTEFGGKIYFADGETNARGVAILLKKNLECKVVRVEKDDIGRELYVTIKFQDKTLQIVNIYAPNEDDEEFFAKVFHGIQQSQVDHIVMGGDMNKILDLNMDRKGGKPLNTKAQEFVNNFLSEENWVDVWRLFNPERKQFTWHKKNPVIMSRLDYFFTHIGSVSLISNCEILPATISDHCPVVMSIQMINVPRGAGYWKLNVKLLEDKEYVDEVNEIFDLAETRYVNKKPNEKLEMIKIDVKEFSIQYAKAKNRKRKENKEKWERQLKAAYKKLEMVNLQSERATYWIEKANQKIDELTTNLQNLAKIAAQGAIIRSRAKWVAEGEHCTKYFLNLEKYNAKAKVMSAIHNEKGELTYDLGKILQAQEKFYQNLYTKDERVKCELENITGPKISDLQREGLEKEIELEEI